ncbi:ADP-ribosylglycohydrolase family protein [Agromyces seonyuensis]|uniref:ADP-ribosylglycohydrolase family protein n=1 Tax=Agromyces seonyuensis TaxID=2662446 RepID=A0A6I4NYE5_9MICO|nr:ADP-ribosylglycohydrolase family protein [Agromyces seonyuensis]MWB99333.1 ADP-ribosylglycohydrolase family protein [Agromyces seonyuensis]
MTLLTSIRLDRCSGAVLGSAAGDALGAPYEFQPSVPDAMPITLHAGGPWELGEWTDDTSMAVPILRALARGERVEDAAVLGGIVAEWRGWAVDAKDVGIQTRQVLARTDPDASGVRLAGSAYAAASTVHRIAGRSAGNGSLMRTGPLALGYLDDADAPALATAARSVSELTHYEWDAGDACVIWSLAIRHAVLTGEFDVRGPVGALPTDRRALWHERLDAAEASGHPRDIPGDNGWVVAALQAAWCAIVHAQGFEDAVERAVRAGDDTDTVAAIAGALAGARWGAASVPFGWRRHLHGWPGLDASELQSLAEQAALGEDAVVAPVAPVEVLPGDAA